MNFVAVTDQCLIQLPCFVILFSITIPQILFYAPSINSIRKYTSKLFVADVA